MQIAANMRDLKDKFQLRIVKLEQKKKTTKKQPQTINYFCFYCLMSEVSEKESQSYFTVPQPSLSSTASKQLNNADAEAMQKMAMMT